MENWISSPQPTDKESEGSLISNSTAHDGGSQDTETSAFTEARQRRVERLEETEAKIEQLILERDKLRTEVAALDSLLGHETSPFSTGVEVESAVSQRQTPNAPNPDFGVGGQESSRQSPALKKSVDATLEVLRRHGRPLHYREIHRRVAKMGLMYRVKIRRPLCCPDLAEISESFGFPAAPTRWHY